MNFVATVMSVCERRSELVTRVYRNVCLGLLTFVATCFGLQFYCRMSTVVMLARFAIIPSLLIPLIVQMAISKLDDFKATALFYGYATCIATAICPLLYFVAARQILIASVATGFLFWFALYLARNIDMDSTDLKLLTIGIGVLIAASLLNIFLRLPMLELFVCVLGMAVSVGLSAYEIYEFETANIRPGYDINKLSIFISLSLLTKIINIFVYMIRFLRVTGIGRNQD